MYIITYPTSDMLQNYYPSKINSKCDMTDSLMIHHVFTEHNTTITDKSAISNPTSTADL